MMRRGYRRIGLQAAHVSTWETATMSDPVQLFQRAQGEFDRRVGAIKDDQWTDPTPCSDWDVRALVHHLVYEMVWAPPLFEGKSVADVGDRFEGDILGTDPKQAWKVASASADASVGTGGAMDGTVHLSFGDVPGSEYTMQLVCDLTVHAWDLAKGIGADDALDPELVDTCLAEMRKSEDMIRASGLFGEKVEVDAGADPQTQLLGIVGRRR
jgi:uncharacterized protein (TIGR03086 family)